MTDRIPCRGWPNCYRLANDRLELIATADVVPRLVHFSSSGEPSQFGGLDVDFGQMGGQGVAFAGGHRLWYSPEEPRRTHAPDSTPVEVTIAGDSITLNQPVEAWTGIRKTIAVMPHCDHVQMRHKLPTARAWPVELAPWALTVPALLRMSIAPLPIGYKPGDAPAECIVKHEQ